MSTEETVSVQMEFATIEEHTVTVVAPPPTDAPNAGITPVAPNPGITSVVTNPGITSVAPNPGITTVAPNPGITPVAPNAEITNAGIKQEFIESKEQNEGTTILSDEVVLELTEEFLTEILKTVDDLCNKIKNGDPDLERTLEVNQILNYGVNCYRLKLSEMMQARGLTKEPQEEFKYEMDLPLPDFSESYSDFFPEKTGKRKRKKTIKTQIKTESKAGIRKVTKTKRGKKNRVGRPTKDRPDSVIDDEKLFPFFTVTEDNKFECSFCHTTYQGRRHLLTHLNDNHHNAIKESPNFSRDSKPSQQYDCEKKMCRKLYGAKRRNLWCTQCTIVSQIPKPKKPYVPNKEPKEYKLCPECGMSVQNLKPHLRNVHYREEQTCSQCGRKLPSINSLKQHIKKVHEKVPCVQCGKLIGVLCMKRHVYQAHTPNDQKKYKCEICGKGFSVKENFLEHNNVHTGEKPFKCKFCSACFASRGTHAAHQRSHLGHRRNYTKK